MPDNIAIKLHDTFRSSANFSGDARNRRIVVAGWAEGLTVDQTYDQNVAMFAVLLALQAQYGVVVQPTGSPHPVDGSLYLSNVSMRGMSHDSVMFTLTYEAPTGMTPTVIIYEIDSDERSVTHEFYPSTRLPIQIGWDGRPTANPTDRREGKGGFIPVDVVGLPLMETVTRISATISRQGFLDESTLIKLSGCVNLVNDAMWMGRPAGCWKMSRYKGMISPISGFYSIRAEAYTLAGLEAPFRDFRRMAILHNRLTGRKALPDIAKIEAALQAPYAFGAINADSSDTPPGNKYNPLRHGFVVDGPYRMVSFPKLWSILTSL